MNTTHWIVGAVVVGGGLLVLHNASASEKPAEKKGDKPKAAEKPATNATPTTAPAARVSSFPVGTHVEAQYRDSKWYGGTVANTNLADPNAIRWDAGTVPAGINPKTGSSPANAVRAAKAGAAPATPSKGTPSVPALDAKEIARKVADAAAAAQTEANARAANPGTADPKTYTTTTDEPSSSDPLYDLAMGIKKVIG